MEQYSLNIQITDLWNQFHGSFTNLNHEKVINRIPNYLSKPKKDTKILFIGLNPAFQEKEKTHKNYVNYTFNRDIINDEISRFSEMNENSKKKGEPNYYAKYFNIFHEFSNELGEKEFEHCDVFLMRETDSKIVKHMVEKDDGKLNEFGLAQLKILEMHIANTIPEIIIIPNAMASDYYRENLINGQTIDKEKGVYYTEINNKKIPTILCGSWQYGRLDQYTKEILLRHIKNAMN